VELGGPPFDLWESSSFRKLRFYSFSNEQIEIVVIQTESQSLVTSAATLKEFVHLAKTDSSGLVRLALGSTLQRLPVSQRADLAAPLLARQEDANDHNLPLVAGSGTWVMCIR